MQERAGIGYLFELCLVKVQAKDRSVWPMGPGELGTCPCGLFIIDIFQIEFSSLTDISQAKGVISKDIFLFVMLKGDVERKLIRECGVKVGPCKKVSAFA